jgi:hypothetical protein
MFCHLTLIGECRERKEVISPSVMCVFHLGQEAKLIEGGIIRATSFIDFTCVMGTPKR